MLSDKLRTTSELAEALGVSRRHLVYLTYGSGRRYHNIGIKKRRGGIRTISQPSDGLKEVQRRLARVLEVEYRPGRCVTGFTKGQSIARNAGIHVACRWVLNVDLKDFFPSIHFGRVRGLLMAPPYGVPAPVATVVAQLCCNEGRLLPQGAPTSPILSNMLCAKLDAELTRLARRYRVSYTRYGDDLSFSSNDAFFPAGLARRAGEGGASLTEVGENLEAIVKANGFEINATKVRLQRSDERQIVTGIIVNEFPNISKSLRSRIRAMLHAWKVYGPDAAQQEFLLRYDTKHRGPYGDLTFKRVVKGYIDYVGMIRGVDDSLYRRFLEQYATLDRDYRIKPLSLVRPNHVASFRDGIWVVESDALMIQGTAFEIADSYAVTCAHVVSDNDGRPADDVVAFRPRRFASKTVAQVVALDSITDVAVLRLGNSSGYSFQVHSADLREGKTVTIAGFPQYSPGNSLWRQHGSVTGYSHHMGSPRALVSQPIVSGASGSPVMDSSHRVIGVASMGADSMESSSRSATVRYGVIPSRLVQDVLRRSDRERKSE